MDDIDSLANCYFADTRWGREPEAPEASPESTSIRPPFGAFFQGIQIAQHHATAAALVETVARLRSISSAPDAEG